MGTIKGIVHRIREAKTFAGEKYISEVNSSMGYRLSKQEVEIKNETGIHVVTFYNEKMKFIEPFNEGDNVECVIDSFERNWEFKGRTYYKHENQGYSMKKV